MFHRTSDKNLCKCLRLFVSQPFQWTHKVFGEKFNIWQPFGKLMNEAFRKKNSPIDCCVRDCIGRGDSNVGLRYVAAKHWW